MKTAVATKVNVSGPMVMDFKSGKLVPVAAGEYPVGTVASYGDQANPRKRSVITGPATGDPWQPCISETGGRSQVSRSCIEGPGGWRLEDCPPMTPAEVLAFTAKAEATRQALDAEAAETSRREAEDTASEQDRLRREHPNLELAEGSSKSPWALAAANIRKLLRGSFPGHKFSVTSESYSMGNAVNIHWTDGPTTKEVDDITGGFVSSGFDGMQDLSYSVSSPWHIFGDSKHVSTSRELSPESVESVARELYPQQDPAQMAEDYRQGRGYNDPAVRHLSQEVGKRSFYAPPAPKTPRKASKPAAGPSDPPQAPEGVTVSENAEKGGLEIRFPGKPSAAIRGELKANGWRWSRFAGCWWKRDAPGVREEAEGITGGHVAPSPAGGSPALAKPAKPAAPKGQRLIDLAATMDKAIEDKMNPGVANQNPTPRRLRIAESMRKDGERLAMAQALLYKLGEDLNAGREVPEAFRAVRSKKAAKEATWKHAEVIREYAGETGHAPDPVQVKINELCGCKIPGFFLTPPELAARVVGLAGIEPGHKVLEPSAGIGSLVDACPEPGKVQCLEVNSRLREILEAKGHRLVGRDFLEWSGDGEGFDRVVMNPPFEGGRDMEHIQHAYAQLRPGGRLVAILSEGCFFREDRKARAFREWISDKIEHEEKNPEGSFKGTITPTGVATRTIVLTK